MKKNTYNKTWYSCLIYSILIASILIFYSPIKLSCGLRDFFLGILFGLCIYVLSFIVKILSSRSFLFRTETHRFKINIGNRIQYCPLLLSISSTVAEELLLRSYALYLCSQYFPIHISIVINSILFYLIHFDKRIFELTISAVVYCLVVIYTGNVFTSVVAHIFYNLLTYLVYEKKDK